MNCSNKCNFDNGLLIINFLIQFRKQKSNTDKLRKKCRFGSLSLWISKASENLQVPESPSLIEKTKYNNTVLSGCMVHLDIQQCTSSFSSWAHNARLPFVFFHSIKKSYNCFVKEEKSRNRVLRDCIDHNNSALTLLKIKKWNLHYSQTVRINSRSPRDDSISVNIVTRFFFSLLTYQTISMTKEKALLPSYYTARPGQLF